MKHALIFCLLFTQYCAGSSFFSCFKRPPIYEDGENEHSSLLLQNAKSVNNENECSICFYDIKINGLTLSKKGKNCGHRFHIKCLENWQDQEVKRTKSGESVIYQCPECNTPYIPFKGNVLSSIFFSFFGCCS